MLRPSHLLTFIHEQVRKGGKQKVCGRMDRSRKERPGVSRQRSSFLRADHLRDEVDDGVGRLVRVQLSEEVADVVGCASLLARHEPEQPGKPKEH